MGSDIAPNHFIINIRRELESTRVFRTDWGPNAVRSDFADLLCERCAKIDEWAAVNRGIPVEVRVSRPIDIANSDDGMVLVSRKVVDILTNAAGDDVIFFPFQNGEYSVMWPLNVVEVTADCRLNRKKHAPKQVVSLREPRCSYCDRPRTVTVRPEFGNYTQEDRIVGLKAESRVVSFMLIVHNQIGDLLNAAGVSGWKREKILPFTYNGQDLL